MRFSITKQIVTPQYSAESAVRLGVISNEFNSIVVKQGAYEDEAANKRVKRLDFEMETPNAIIYTMKGSVPHLTLDLQDECIKEGIFNYFYEHM